MTVNGFLHSHSLPFPFSQFPFLPIPISNFVTNSHSHEISTGLFRFLIPIPIFEQSFNRCGINNFGLSKTQTVCALLVVESKTDHDSQNHALLHYFSA